MTPVLSLVTGTLNRPESFKRLVDSIVANTSVPWELVVSDASDVPYPYAWTEQVRIFPEQPRLGCVKGYNRAFKETQGTWVIYLNDDAEVMPGYDETSIRFMEQHPEIGLGALHYSEDGGPYHANSAWGCIYGNFGILRRTLGQHIGWFDEDLIMYGNDNSLTFRVLLSGYGVTDIPEARILHHSVKDQTRIENQQHRREDNKTLSRKYMPLREQWLRVYRQYRRDDTQAWGHGVRPRKERISVR